MSFVLNKVWVLFVIAVVLIPGFIEAFNVGGSKMLPELMDGISLSGEFLVEESHQFKEVLMSAYDPLFGRFKSGNEVFASTNEILSGLAVLLFFDMPSRR
jgi:hypothetical protein